MNKCCNVKKIEFKVPKAMIFKIITANLTILNVGENKDKLYWVNICKNRYLNYALVIKYRNNYQ